jgi:hypothetical protein
MVHACYIDIPTSLYTYSAGVSTAVERLLNRVPINNTLSYMIYVCIYLCIYIVYVYMHVCMYMCTYVYMLCRIDLHILYMFPTNGGMWVKWDKSKVLIKHVS